MYEQKRPGPFRSAAPLVLASASPRRRELLAGLGLDFLVVPSEAEELPPGAQEEPRDFALGTARVKVLDVAGRYPKAVIIGADTIVVADERIIGKPGDEAEAADTLGFLCGRRHEVLTACCLCLPGGDVREFVVSTAVWLAGLSREAILAYVATGEPMDKAGSYAAQGIGSFIVERIEGSYTNVVGLPMTELLNVLLDTGFVRTCSPEEVSSRV